MGDFGKCLECAENFEINRSGDEYVPEAFLIQLAAAYIACFSRGEWLQAMNLALQAYKEYLSERPSYDETMVC